MNEIEQLKQRITELENYVTDRKRQQLTYPLDSVSLQVLRQTGGATLIVALGGTGTTTLTGILKGSGTSPFTAIVPKSGSGSFYVAPSSGGAVTTKVDWTDGIITAIT